jgi:hypothetical protein
MQSTSSSGIVPGWPNIRLLGVRIVIWMSSST